MHDKEGIFISQTKYLKDLLKMFGLETCKPIGTPMVTGHLQKIRHLWLSRRSTDIWSTDCNIWLTQGRI